MDFGSKMEACWPPKSDLKSSSQKMWKIAFGASPLVPNGVHGFQVGSKNRSKTDQKRSSTWEGILASIFERFCWILKQVGVGNAPKIDPKRHRKNDEKKKPLDGFWGGNPRAGQGRGGPDPPPFLDFHSPEQPPRQSRATIQRAQH